jgi:hypothetical protein
MTVEAQFCCNSAAQMSFPGTKGTGGVAGWRLGLRHDLPLHRYQAAGWLRETTQSRSHEPTAQPQRYSANMISPRSSQ